MKQGMSLKQCYAILGVPEGSELELIKRAYRKRAFELHPDLNPSDGASRQFQQLNEAYVVLIRLLDSRQAKAPPPEAEKADPCSTNAKAGRDAYREQARKEKEREEKARRERQEREREERQEAERRARERQEQEEKEKREEERRARLREEIERQEAERLVRKEKAKETREHQARMWQNAEREREEKLRQEKLREEQSHKDAEPKAEAHKRSYSKPGQFSSSGSYRADREQANAASQPEDSSNFSDSDREILLNDLLNDPFARRVYEDIYSEIQQRRHEPKAPEPQQVTPSKIPARDTGGNIGQTLMGWMRGQIDQRQELFFPAQNLYPGAKFRLKIRPGLSGEPRTIEVTLPQDFAPGKAIRLKGMGKKVGKWQGDLYLTFQTKP